MMLTLACLVQPIGFSICKLDVSAWDRLGTLLITPGVTDVLQGCPYVTFLYASEES
jgi:hypothetical protein